MTFEPTPFDQQPAWMTAYHTRDAKIGSWVCAVQSSALQSSRKTYLTCVESFGSGPGFKLGFQHIDDNFNAILFSDWLIGACGTCKFEYSVDDEPSQVLWAEFIGPESRIGLGQTNSIILARDLIGRQKLGVRIHLSKFDLLDSVYDVRGFADAHAVALRQFVLEPSYISPARRWGLLT